MKHPKTARFICIICHHDIVIKTNNEIAANMELAKLGWKIIPRDGESDYGLHCAKCGG